MGKLVARHREATVLMAAATLASMTSSVMSSTAGSYRAPPSNTCASHGAEHRLKGRYMPHCWPPRTLDKLAGACICPGMLHVLWRLLHPSVFSSLLVPLDLSYRSHVLTFRSTRPYLKGFTPSLASRVAWEAPTCRVQQASQV